MHTHQIDVLTNSDRKSQLLIAPTGSGKTLSGFLPTLIELDRLNFSGLHTIYVSPLKALAADIKRNLMIPIEEMGLNIKVEDRTGDTTAKTKRRQRIDPPQILLTTPESLALLISFPEANALFANLERIIIDEIHALVDNKRGHQLLLAISRLQSLPPIVLFFSLFPPWYVVVRERRPVTRASLLPKSHWLFISSA